jgi:hypothetical protein
MGKEWYIRGRNAIIPEIVMENPEIEGIYDTNDAEDLALSSCDEKLPSPTSGDSQSSNQEPSASLPSLEAADESAVQYGVSDDRDAKLSDSISNLVAISVVEMSEDFAQTRQSPVVESLEQHLDKTGEDDPDGEWEPDIDISTNF